MAHKLPRVLRRLKYLQMNPLQQKASSTRMLTLNAGRWVGAARHPDLDSLGQQETADVACCFSLGGGGTLPALGAWTCTMNWTHKQQLDLPVRALCTFQAANFITSPARVRGGRGISLNSDNHIITWQLYAANNPPGGLANLKSCLALHNGKLRTAASLFYLLHLHSLQ